jgi:hypothetical protein
MGGGEESIPYVLFTKFTLVRDAALISPNTPPPLPAKFPRNVEDWIPTVERIENTAPPLAAPLFKNVADSIVGSEYNALQW